MRTSLRSTSPIIASAVLALAATALAAPAATGAAAASPYKVTLKISQKEAVAKQDKVTLTGAVFPKPPANSSVVVQAKYEDQSSWRRIGTAPVKADGTYKFVEKPGTSLDRVYRVVKKADAKHEGDKSRERGLHVTKWQWLTGMTTSAAEGFAAAGLMPINGDDYTHTLYGPTTSVTGFTEYTLGRNCLVLEGTLGLSDRTETGGRATMQLKQEGVVTYDRTFGLGESEAVSVDVRDVYRLRIDYAQVAGTPATEPSFGAARVLCD
jgi:hypothetical protein